MRNYTKLIDGANKAMLEKFEHHGPFPKELRAAFDKYIEERIEFETEMFMSPLHPKLNLKNIRQEAADVMNTLAFIIAICDEE